MDATFSKSFKMGLGVGVGMFVASFMLGLFVYIVVGLMQPPAGAVREPSTAEAESLRAAQEWMRAYNQALDEGLKENAEVMRKHGIK